MSHEEQRTVPRRFGELGGYNPTITERRGETRMTANYLAETDFLLETGQILRGETRKLPTLEHLKALQQLVREAQRNIMGETTVDLQDWLTEAGKVL